MGTVIQSQTNNIFIRLVINHKKKIIAIIVAAIVGIISILIKNSSTDDGNTIYNIGCGNRTMIIETKGTGTQKNESKLIKDGQTIIKDILRQKVTDKNIIDSTIPLNNNFQSNKHYQEISYNNTDNKFHKRDYNHTINGKSTEQSLKKRHNSSKGKEKITLVSKKDERKKERGLEILNIPERNFSKFKGKCIEIGLIDKRRLTDTIIDVKKERQYNPSNKKTKITFKSGIDIYADVIWDFTIIE